MTAGQRRADAVAGAGRVGIGADEPGVAVEALKPDAVVSGTVLDGYGREAGGGLVLEGGVLARVLPRGYSGEADVSGALIAPGLVDVHCHGGGGASFPDDVDPRSIRKAIEAHRASGTTALLASLVSMADPLPAIRALLPFCESGDLAGIHMEGPYVSPHKAGAQNPAAIRGADPEELTSWLEEGKGFVKTMTIAPEADHAMEAVRILLAHGAKPSWGHTAASGEIAAQALEATSRCAAELGFEGVPQTVTHLFNAMPPIDHREPGPVREFLAAAREGGAIVETIGDGVHLAPALVEDVHGWVRGNAAFVTDAMAAAGMPEGRYALGGLDVDVREGAARLAGKQTIAGGCSRLSDQLALFARRGALPFGQIVRACVAAPAKAASIEGAKGVTLDFELGKRPNFVVFDRSFSPVCVVRE